MPSGGAVGPRAVCQGGGDRDIDDPVLGGEAAYRGPFSSPPRPVQHARGPGRFDTETIFGSGFQIQSKDSEYQLQFHDLTQVEGRFVGTGGQEPVNSTFLINRQWFMFAGRLTKPYEYFVSWRRGSIPSPRSTCG